MKTDALDQDCELTPLIEITTLRNPHYTILVWPFMYGQYRIQLTDKRQPDFFAPDGHGAIVQQLCTYSGPRFVETCVLLGTADDPLALARSWARPWNCESPGGRIRLDNEPREIPKEGTVAA